MFSISLWKHICQEFRQIKLLSRKPVDFHAQEREWLSQVHPWGTFPFSSVCVLSGLHGLVNFLYSDFDQEHWREWWWCKALHQRVMWWCKYWVWCNRVNVGQKRTWQYPETKNLGGNSFFSKVDFLQILSETASSFSLQYEKGRKFWSPDLWITLSVSPASA